MKLFIWEGGGVLTDYTNGMVVALAPDLEQAFEAIALKDHVANGNFPPSPTRVIDLGECSNNPQPTAAVCWGGG